MRIKTQLLISIITFSIVLIIIGSSVALTQLQINELNNRSLLTDEIQTGASDLNYISNNYFLYQNDSYIASWQTKSSTLSNEIAKLNSTDPQQQALVETVSNDVTRLNSLFAGVVSFLSQAPRNISVRVLPDFQTQWSGMAMQIQALASDSQMLSQNIQDKTTQAIQINTILTVALLSVFLAFFVIIYFVAYRRAARSITKLKDGIGLIGSGNLDYSIEAGKKDEIEDISKAVNQMAANLKTVTASKTDLEQAQTSLRESEQRWSTTLASIGDAVIATDTSGKIVFMNGEAETLTGWVLSEASQKPVKTIFNIINEQSRLEVDSPIDRVLREGMVVGLANHTVLIRKDGTEVPIDDSGAPIRDKDGKTTGVVLVFRDITERKKAEDTIQQQKNVVQQERDRLSSLLNSITDEVWFADTNKKFTLANPSAVKDFKLDSSTEVVDVENLAATLEVYRSDGSLRPVEEAPPLRALKGEIVKNQEEIVRTPVSGELCTRIVSSAPVRDANGDIIGSVSVVRDITERKKIEEAAGRQAALIDLSPDAIIVRKLDGTIILWSKGAEKLYGWTKEEAIGQDINTLLNTELPQSLEMIENILKSEGKWSGEIIHICKNGSKLVVQSYWLAKFGSDGKIFEMLESNVDITDRKQMQIKLEEYGQNLEKLVEERTFSLKVSEEKYRMLFDSIDEGFCIIEMVFDSNYKPLDYRLLEVNASFERQTGMHDAKGKLMRSFAPNHESYWFEIYGKVALTGQPIRFTNEAKSLNRYYDVYAFPVGEGKIRNVGILFNDISQRMNLEIQLKDAERLAAIGATAGMVGHDIRNPLQAIISDVYLAKTDLASTLDSEEKKNAVESLDEIEKNVTYINKIVQDLQDFARPLNPRAEEIDLKPIIDDLLKNNDLPNNVKVSVKIETGKVVADSTFINRIMYNLVNNAVQAMPNGGKLTIHAYKKSNDAVIAVKDTGGGIPEAVKNKLFTPMFTTKSKGQGFGLAVIKRMTEALGGTVTFESQEGKGTTFTVCIPQSPKGKK